MMRFRRSALAFFLLPLLGAQGQKAEIEKLAPFYPTPETVVERMLALGGLKPGEKMFIIRVVAPRK